MDRPRYIPEDFYLGNGSDKVDKMDVYNLADFAISLMPISEEEMNKGFIDENKTRDCISTLIAYMDNYSKDYKEENLNKMNNLVKCYNLIIHDMIGKEFLFRTIHFKFLTILLTSKGFSIDSINAFRKASDDLKIVEEIGTVINKEAALRNYGDDNKPKSR